ncbi:MAG: sugar porter family MFS transporter [bacterium]
MQRFRYILFVTVVTALGGILFGYDTAVIAGAIGNLEKYFNLNPFQTGWAGASAIIGCIPGAMVAGFLSDRYGRKKILLLSAVLYTISAIWSAIPQTLTEFIIARFIGGVGIGVSSMVCPTYIAEIAPEKYRGRLAALFQLGIVIGIFVVFFINMLIQQMGDEVWNLNSGWRWMLGSETLPAALFFFLLFLVPESPRWLLQNRRENQARGILNRMVGAEQAERDIAAVKAVSGEEEGKFVELFEPTWRKPLIIAIGLALFAQFSGINSIMYYAPEVFKSAGATTDAAFTSSVWVGLINLIFTFVAIAYVDRAGRKILLVIGTFIQTLSLGYVGWKFYEGGGGVSLLIGVLAFVGAFSMAMGPVPWIMISEIFPGRIRGRAASVGVLTIWVCCYIVAQTFPMLTDSIGAAKTFWIYALCSLASLIFVIFYVPETKGKTLEEIEMGWRSKSVGV